MKSLIIKILIAPIVFIGSFFNHHDVIPDPVVTQSQAQQMIREAMNGQVSSEISLGTTATLPINGSTYNLSGSGVTSSATSFILSSLTIPQNGYKIVDADASATFYMTLEPGSRTRQEVVACTTIVQNSGGTATISNCTRGMSPISPYTASTTLKFAHPGGSQVIFGDAAQLFNEYAALGNDQTITGLWTFDDNDTFRPRLDADTDTAVSTALVTLGQLSRTASAGASNASETIKGIVELATAVEQASSTSAGSTAALLSLRALYATSTASRGCDGSSVAGALCVIVAKNNGSIDPQRIATSSTENPYNFGNIVNLNGNGTHLGQQSFTATTTFATTTNNGANFGGNIVNNFIAGETISGNTTPQPVMFATSSARVYLVDSDVASTTNFIGFAINNSAVLGTSYVQTDGIVRGFTGLTNGSEYYVSDTAGTLSTTPGTSENYVGRAVSTTQIQIEKTRSPQFMGAVTLPATAPAFARYAIVQANGVAAVSCTSFISTQITVFKIGVTSGTNTIGALCGGGNPTGSITVTWSGSVVSGTYSNNSGATAGASTGTAYFYK